MLIIWILSQKEWLGIDILKQRMTWNICYTKFSTENQNCFRYSEQNKTYGGLGDLKYAGTVGEVSSGMSLESGLYSTSQQHKRLTSGH